MVVSVPLCPPAKLQPRQTFPLARIQPQLAAKLACAANSTSCMTELVSLLRALSDKDISDLARQQFEVWRPSQIAQHNPCGLGNNIENLVAVWS